MSDKTIRQIYPFGPAVGKFTVHGTVADTIKRERLRLKREQEQAKADAAEAQKKVSTIDRRTK